MEEYEALVKYAPKAIYILEVTREEYLQHFKEGDIFDSSAYDEFFEYDNPKKIIRFKYEDAKSHKFWTIEIGAYYYKTIYGKMGTSGQESIKTNLIKEKLEKEVEALIKEKKKKGYVLF